MRQMKIQGWIRKLHKNAVKASKDNKGSSIVIVIIAMAMIGILATTLLWMAYMNYMIKVNDVKNKNSFYSAETVVEQIMAGMQREASNAASASYQELLSNWDRLAVRDTSGNIIPAESEQNWYSTFATTYMDTIIEEFKGASTGEYDREKLKAFADSVFFDESIAGGVDIDAWNNGNAVGEAPKAPVMEVVNNNSIILRNIFVSYYDSDNDRLSIVNTDICLDVPKLVFTQTSSNILYDYLLIGNQGIKVADSCGTISAEGSIYAGTDDSGKGGLTVNPASTLTIDDGMKVISKGDITVQGPAAGLIVHAVRNEESGSDTYVSNSVYATNLKLDSGTLSLDSKTYVANDLSLAGSGSKATLTSEYYGYGMSTGNGLDGDEPIAPENSSAIIINGRSSTVDMSGINRLLLAGRAYIGQSVQTQTEPEGSEGDEEETPGEGGTPVNPPKQSVMMGESIAVKGDQIAYLVPAECIGVVDDTTVIGQNPILTDQVDMEQYEADNLDENGVQHFKEVDFNKKVYRLGGKSLSEFGVTDMKHIRKIYTQYKSSTGSSAPLAYYYLVLDKENASKYFVQYYDFNSNKEMLDHYFDRYATGGIWLGDYASDETQYTILGNSVVSSVLTESGVTLLTATDTDDGDESEGTEGEGTGEEGTGEETPTGGYSEVSDNSEKYEGALQGSEVTAQSTKIAQTYESLTTNLTEDTPVTPGDTTTNVFNSLIKEAGTNGLADYLADHGHHVTFTTADGLIAYFTDGDVTLSDIPDYKKVRLIVSLKDVTLDKNFTGQVVAKGTITIDGASILKRDKDGLYKVLNATTGVEGETLTPIDFFVNGGGSLINGAQQAEVDKDGNLLLDYSEIVRYMNWIKK